MADINEMLDNRENEILSDEEFELIVRNEKDYNVFYTQPGCTSQTTLQQVIDNGNFPETLGIDPKRDLRFKKAKSKDAGQVAPEPLSVKSGNLRAATMGELGFNVEGFDTLSVNTDGGNG
jgi:hypothetical protein